MTGAAGFRTWLFNEGMTMLALTICEPYATLIILGKKPVENRTWPTQYRGPLLIHAGKSREWLSEDGDTDPRLNYGIPLSQMTFGAILGVVDMVACLTVEGARNMRHEADSTTQEFWDAVAASEHTEGPWCFVLRNPRRFKTPVPFPYRGAQGLFDIPTSAFAIQLEQLG